MQKNTIIISFTTILLWMSMYVNSPILPVYAEEMGATSAMVGLIGGSYGLAQLVLRFPLGVLSERTNRDRLLLAVGFVVLLASAVLFLCFDSIAIIIVARGLAGAAAAWWAPLSTLYARCYPEDSQVKAQGHVNAIANISKFGASILCGAVAFGYGYQGTFVAALIIAIAGLALVFWVKPSRTRAVTPPQPGEVKAVMRNKPLIIFSTLAGISLLISNAIPLTFAVTAAHSLGADSGMLGVLSFAYFLGAAVGGLFMSTKQFRRMGNIHTVAFSFAISAVASFPVFYTASIPVIIVMSFVIGVGLGMCTGVTAGLAMRCVEPRLRGVAMGIHQALYSVGMLVGPVVTGVLIEYVSFNTAYWILAAVSAVTAALCYVAIPKQFAKMT